MKKRLLTMMLALTMVAGLFVGCGKSDKDASNQVGSEVEENVPDTMAYGLRTLFREEVKKDTNVENVANALIESPLFGEVVMVVEPVSEGDYTPGFDGDVSGFRSAAKFCPMINTIPFIGYIFETDDPNALEALLKEKAALNWNVCTIADEMVTDVQGNYVFFVMSPESFDAE